MKKNLNADSKQIAGTNGASSSEAMNKAEKIQRLYDFYVKRMEDAWDHRDPDSLELAFSMFEDQIVYEEDQDLVPIWQKLRDIAEEYCDLYYMLY